MQSGRSQPRRSLLQRHWHRRRTQNGSHPFFHGRKRATSGNGPTVGMRPRRDGLCPGPEASEFPPVLGRSLWLRQGTICQACHKGTHDRTDATDYTNERGIIFHSGAASPLSSGKESLPSQVLRPELRSRLAPLPGPSQGRPRSNLHWKSLQGSGTVLCGNTCHAGRCAAPARRSASRAGHRLVATTVGPASIRRYEPAWALLPKGITPYRTRII